MELALLGEEVLVEIGSAYRHTSERTTRAASDVLQSGVTTLSAIALLLRHGHVIDGEARCRVLHEPACTTALLTIDDDPAAIATRYLVHGRRVHPEHDVYREGLGNRKVLQKQLRVAARQSPQR